MLGPPPTGLKRRATVRMLPRPHHLRPPAQRVRSSASPGHSSEMLECPKRPEQIGVLRAAGGDGAPVKDGCLGGSELQLAGRGEARLCAESWG